ncbi:MAG: hypothetical protein GXP25_22145 [Planctomycetes bacterium]|nr:hypothetical protein [Planctomycetota bacterium]
MIYRPAILVPQIAFLLLIIVVLAVLHGYVSPQHFHVAVIVSIALFACFTLVFWFVPARMLSKPYSALAKQMVLTSRQRPEDGYRAASEELKSLIGQCGVALTPLRPSGTAVFDDRRLSVVTEGEFIEQNTRVEVTAVQGSRVIVRRASARPGGKSGSVS